MNYHFFDYKDNLIDVTSNLFSIPHIIFIILTLTIVPVISILLRNTSHKKIEKFLKVFSIIMFSLEIARLVWEGLYNLNLGEILPLNTSSFFVFALLLGAYGKGKFKKYSISFITTIGLLSGFLGVLFCNNLNYYPFWTFGALYSLFFYFSMYAVGLFLLISKYKILEWPDMVRAWIPMAVLSILVSPLNYEYGADYMQLYSGAGMPALNLLAQTLASVKLRFLFTIIMLFSYIGFAGIVVSFVKLLYNIKNRKMRKEKIKSIKNKP